MKDFFSRIPYREAERLGHLTRLTYDLRENRKGILAAHEVASESALLTGIVSHAIDEHPGYENYLAARILQNTHDEARQVLADSLAEAQKS